MNGFTRRVVLLLGCTLAGLGCGSLPTRDSCDSGCGATAGCGATGGCGTCSNQTWDRCYPQRYANLSARAVNRAMAPQVQNGHVLDQTVWNYFFEPGTDKLTPGGLDHLAYLSRRRPAPDKVIYLATATDITYDQACPERYAGARQELDGLRVAAIQKFLVASNAGRCSDFQVLVHDPGDVSVRTNPVGSSVQQMYGRFRGGLSTGAGGGGGGGGGGGATGGSGSVGGFAR